MENLLIKKSKFTLGQIVNHKKYHYRGVIFDVDEHCLADEEWYQSNKNQPTKDQPWYHILVDDEEISTYVAEENIELSFNQEPIEHPLVNEFFTQFQDGSYSTEFHA